MTFYSYITPIAQE